MNSKNYIKRIFSISEDLELQSQFLFGPRQTGKTSFIENQLDENVVKHVTLLNTTVANRYKANPSLLYQEVMALEVDSGVVVIDEIQRVPELLNEVHRLIESTDLRFLLTGSSARRLTRAGVNLLGGRAGRMAFHPFTYPEVKDLDFSLSHVFRTGMLPKAYLSARPEKLLQSYTSTFLTDEVQAEAQVRNLPAFTDFMRLAAISSGELLNYSNIASDSGISKNSVKAWYGILTDCLLGFELPVYGATKKRKAIDRAKYYLFDLGAIRSLRSIPTPVENMTEYGTFFEHFICHELVAYLDYHGADYRNRNLTFWRSVDGYEVDFVYAPQIAIETKTCRNAGPKHLAGLRAFKEEGICGRYILVCQEECKRVTDDGIWIYPWKDFLEELWSGKLIQVQTLPE